MTRKFFGTDGIRGRTNQAPMTAEIAMKVGMAAGAHFLRGDHKHRVVIGKDTRLSGYMIESALVAGFTSVGMDVVMVGPMPTPAVAMLTRSMRADLGVMISASHNPYADNGIKLFGPDGYKLSDADEAAIEAMIDSRAQAGAGRGDRPRAAGRGCARALYPLRQVDLSRPSPARRAARSSSIAPMALPITSRPSALWELGADVDRDRRRAQRHQHQRRLRIDGAAGAAGNRDRIGRAISASRSTATPTG